MHIWTDSAKNKSGVQDKLTGEHGIAPKELKYLLVIKGDLSS